MNRTHELPRFREVQRWSDVAMVMVIVVALAAMQWWSFIKQMSLGLPIGSYAAADWFQVIMWLAFGVGLPVLAYWLRMVVEVYPDKIVIEYRPLPVQTILMHNVATVEPRIIGRHPALSSLFQRGPDHMRSFNVSAPTSVQLLLRDRSRVLIGTFSPAQLAAAIAAARYDVKP